MDREKTRGGLGCLIIVAALFICVSVSLFATDRACYAGLSRRIPIYPGATVQTRTHNLFSELGMGITVMTLYSPDDANTVRSWYGRNMGDAARETLTSSDPLLTAGMRISRADWNVARDESGSGTRIILYGNCVN